MEAKWTDEQMEVIFTRKCNLLVAAGAGAGKTAVLVERIIQRILDEKDNIDIDNLLVVTFTNAAASEMRERIGDAMSRELELRPDSKKLQRQLTLLNQSNITTIHSFCLQVIKNNFHIIDLDPSFRVSDNTEAILLKQEAIEETFEDMYEKDENKEFLRLADSYGGKNDLKLQNLILSLYEFAKSSPWPEKWLNDMAERFDIEDDFDFGKSYWSKILIDYLKVELIGCWNKMKSAINIVENAEGIDYYLEPFKIDMEKIHELINSNHWNEFKEKFIKFESAKLSIKKNKDADKEAKEKSKKIRDEVKKKIENIKEEIFIGADTVGRDLKELYPMIKCLVELVIQFDNKYSNKKRERNLVDFSDIEHFCLNILTKKDEQGNIIPSDVALEYRKHFEEILIDEYQDSNEVQEVIMNMISRKNDIPNIFMVGDVKQSIYRFRQAKPELFLSKYSSYSDEKGNNYRRIKLFKNFRSRNGIIAGVNYLFKQIMSKEIGELEYDDEETLESGAQFPDSNYASQGEIEIHLIDKKDEDIFVDEESENIEVVQEKQEETPDNIQIEGRLVAKRIQELINNENLKIYDKNINEYRAISYKDIVILMRATSGWAPTFVEELNNAGIPAFADTSTGYFDTIEIKTIMCLLQIIDNPIQDIPLISVLRSPIESFSPEELIDIRLVNRDISFYEALREIYTASQDKPDGGKQNSVEENEKKKCNLSHISEKLRYKVSNFLDNLDKWRKKVLHMPIDEFIWYLYTETGYFGFSGAMPGGKQRQANLRMLFQRAKQFEKTSYKGLFNFINFINKLKSSSGDMGSAKILGENENVVRIMSIHKSKGLEFPVVILAGTGKNFNLMDTNRSILFHSELGFGPDYVNLERRISYNTLVKQVLKKKLKIETLSEEMRILYVAFTRAKEKLIVTGMVKDIEKTLEKWCSVAACEGEKIPEYAVLNAKSYLDWIGPAVARHDSGVELRKFADDGGLWQAVISGDSKWRVKLWKKESFINTISEDKTEVDIINEIERDNLNLDISSYNEEIHRRFSWKYKYEVASTIPSKFSVSELKRKFSLVDEEESKMIVSSRVLKKPLFLQTIKTLSPAERGTLMHFAMQHIDLEKTSSYEEIKKQIETLVSRQFITQEEAKVIKIDKILKFFKSSLGEKMKNCRQVYREIPFFIEIPTTEIYSQLPDAYKEEKILVQGIIDCYFEEEDGIVLLDYKTDFVENEEEIREKYKVQIYYYSRALEKMTGKAVKRKYLYLFFNDSILEM
jgi:ATP-dependent helicase/nuclease subunit A